MRNPGSLLQRVLIFIARSNRLSVALNISAPLFFAEAEMGSGTISAAKNDVAVNAFGCSRSSCYVSRRRTSASPCSLSWACAMTWRRVGWSCILLRFRYNSVKAPGPTVMRGRRTPLHYVSFPVLLLRFKRLWFVMRVNKDCFSVLNLDNGW